MGLTGTDVAKDAADMVVMDDNIASIAAAVEEGRVIYANIQKAVSYLLSHNIGEITVMLGAAVAGLPLPLLPAQILWINLITDGLPALALAVDPKEPDVMPLIRRPIVGGHHRHDPPVADTCLQSAADPAVGAGRPHVTRRAAAFQDRFLGQGAGGTFFHAGAT